MSSGLLSFLGFGRKEKPSLTQNYLSPPSAETAPLYGDLRNLAKKRINGEGLGFGDDFVNKATNSQAERMRSDYKNYTSPTLDAELSKRGIARSAGPGLATDIKTRALQTNQSDIDQLMERFYVLNEAQKKTDQTEGINLGNELDTQYLNQGNNQASQFNAAEAGNTARTVGVAATNNANSLKRQNQTLGMLMNMAVPGSGMAFNQSAANPATTQNSSSVRLAGTSDDELEQIYQEILKSRGR